MSLKANARHIQTHTPKESILIAWLLNKSMIGLPSILFEHISADASIQSNYKEHSACTLSKEFTSAQWAITFTPISSLPTATLPPLEAISASGNNPQVSQDLSSLWMHCFETFRIWRQLIMCLNHGITSNGRLANYTLSVAVVYHVKYLHLQGFTGQSVNQLKVKAERG